jgi:hypothetical protein
VSEKMLCAVSLSACISSGESDAKISLMLSIVA